MTHRTVNRVIRGHQRSAGVNTTHPLTSGNLVGLAGIEPATSALSVQWSGVVGQALTRPYAVSDLKFPPVVTHT